MLKPKVLLVGIYDTNTVALAPEILRSYVAGFPIAGSFEIATLNLSIFSQSVDEMERQIAAEGASIIGFSTYIWNVTLVRELCRRLDGTLVLGGPQVNEVPPDFFEHNPGVDYVVVGEGEETFKELLEYFAGARPLASVAGVVAPGVRTPPRPVLLDLEQVPSPYLRIFSEHPDLEWVAYETSRGCPFLCGFCTWGYSKKMRYHSLERVFADLDVLLSQSSLERIYLCDSSILLDKARAKQILRHIIDKNRDVVIRYEFNAEHLDDEIIELLLQLPENEFNFGVQTINPPALRAMQRPFKRRKFEENYAKMVRRTERTSITMDLIYGLPGDDLAGFQRSLEYVMGFDHVRWILTNPLILLPGADFHRDREAHGIELRDAESGIVEHTASFPPDEMAKAIKLSFLVSVVYFNEALRDAFKAWAKSRSGGFVPALYELFAALPFPLLETDDYPYLVPSVARDFRARNLAVGRVVTLYPEIVQAFDTLSGGAHRDLLAGWEQRFVPQYHRLRRFAEQDAAPALTPAAGRTGTPSARSPQPDLEPYEQSEAPAG